MCKQNFKSLASVVPESGDTREVPKFRIGSGDPAPTPYGVLLYIFVKTSTPPYTHKTSFLSVASAVPEIGGWSKNLKLCHVTPFPTPYSLFYIIIVRAPSHLYACKISSL